MLDRLPLDAAYESLAEQMLLDAASIVDGRLPDMLPCSTCLPQNLAIIANQTVKIP